MADKNWIAKAVPPSHKGLFTKKAKAAGKSVSEFASEKKDAPGKTGKQARFAMVMKGLRSAK